MANIAHAMWVHGHSLQVEDPSAFNSIVRAGMFMHLDGNKNKTTWVHFAIPTPVIVDDNKLRVGSVMFWVYTKSTDAVLRHVHVYDGDGRIAEHKDVNISGNVGFKRFDVPTHPDLRCGIGISICLEFGGDAVSHVVDFVAAGCDFLP